MTESHTEINIWNPETGITDIDGDPIKMSSSEMLGIKAIWANQQSDLNGSDAGKKLLFAFTERLSREWAIETGVIENLYDIDRGVTQTLIEHGLQADLSRHDSAKAPSEHTMHLIKDQKAILDGIFDFIKGNREISVSYIKELHFELVRSQDTTEAKTREGRIVEIPLLKGEWKKQENYPIRDGTICKYCPVEQTASEMERLIEMHLDHIKNDVPIDVQAAWLHHRFTQIHPFQDGNGRIARSIASLVLIKGGLFPLSVTRDDKLKYIEALEKADNDDLQPLIRLIAKLQRTQLRKASAISSDLIGEESIDDTLDRMEKLSKTIGEERRKSYKKLSSVVQPVAGHIRSRLNEITPKVNSIFEKADRSDNVSVVISSPLFAKWKSQIIKQSAEDFNYVPNTNEHEANIIFEWSHKGILVFLIHGMGKPFYGGMICAPVFALAVDPAEGDNSQVLLTPVAEEGFVFSHNEDPKEVVNRLVPWCDKAIQTTLQEITQNL